MQHARSRTVRISLLVALAAGALAGLAPSAEARNVRLMEPVPDTARAPRVHDILGSLDLRFGGATARGAAIVRRDVVVKGVGTTKMNDVGDDARVRPSDHELCARAFDDAVTQLAFAARGSGATAIVGVISNYEGTLFDDPVHYECHVGALKAAVTLRAQLATSAAVSPPPPAPVAPAPDAAPPPPAATFQPLPAASAASPN
jgi:uncharacterized protein YbjQ (UPF0145 family)